ncbi:glycosyltransferase family 2 protein [Candidatus Peregrinibacteria bacterium]|nr:glycosyltransferase family 2 protein [Candidatus Peregrinibacteria bacterium]
MNTKDKNDDSAKSDVSIFYRYYNPEEFKDRFLEDDKDALEIIIPIIHTNEMWEANLRSIYREIPVKRLLIGDGGCVDNSIEIVKKFPRVELFDHRQYKTLGFSIRKLIEEVDSGWFAYFHSDVFIPEDWFDVMKKYRNQYDWFGCQMQITAMLEFSDENNKTKKRPFAGTQIGKKEAFMAHLGEIDDDYVYRQEDYVFENVVNKGGGKCGFVDEVFHYHQLIHKNSPWARKIKKVSVEMEWSKEELLRASTMQAHGVVKYLKPTPYLAAWISLDLARLLEMKKLNWKEFKKWAAEVNPEWKPYLKYWRVALMRRYLKFSEGDGIIGRLKKWFLK